MTKIFSKFRQDIVGIGLLATGLLVALSLFSFNPTDPSLNSIGVGMKVNNFCGYFGSFLSDALYQLFGLSAWVIAIGLSFRGIATVKGDTKSFFKVKFIWGLLIVLTLASLISVYWPQTKVFQNQIHIGGLLGMTLSKVLMTGFNKVGVQVILWATLVILAIFYSEKSLIELLKSPKSIRQFFNFKSWISMWKTLGKNLESIFKIESRPKLSPDKPLKTKKAEESIEPQETKPTFFPLNKDIEDFSPEPIEPIKVESHSDMNQQRRKVTLKTKVQTHVENWLLPKMNLLEDPPMSRIKVDEREIRRKADLITEKLAIFGVKGEMVAAKAGPAVTMFEFRPEASVKVSKITELHNDLAMTLAVKSLRILAPIPGKDVVGIEIPNDVRETVYLKDLLADDSFWNEDYKLPLSVGKDVFGKPQIMDLRKLPHLLVAGTTGSGKSVFIVSSLIGLIFRHSPKTLKLILIDPKEVDLVNFEKIPHLALPVVTESQKAVNALKWAVREMEKRYKSMSKFGARQIEAFNEKVSALSQTEIEEHTKVNAELEETPSKKVDQYYFQPLPYLVIVVEELADLMTKEKVCDDVENSLVRLAQKARASGIHLILATQTPRKDVVTGLLKTNIPGRISFKVATSLDSRIILDETGAEQLLDKGDMLFKAPATSNIIRHHGPYLSDNEIHEINKFWSSQAEPQYEASAMKAIEGNLNEGSSGDEFGMSEDDYDDMYDQIVAWASTQKAISASGIQTRFSIGYPRAARIVSIMEKEGVVGPANGSKPRQVLIEPFEGVPR